VVLKLTCIRLAELGTHEVVVSKAGGILTPPCGLAGNTRVLGVVVVDQGVGNNALGIGGVEGVCAKGRGVGVVIVEAVANIALRLVAVLSIEGEGFGGDGFKVIATIEVAFDFPFAKQRFWGGCWRCLR